MARAIIVKKTSGTAAQVVATTLPAAMTGRASPAEAADGDEPVFAYIRNLPQPRRGIAGHVKLTFGRGTALRPVPPVTPVGMGKDSRGVNLERVDDLNARQVASWMRQATALPGFGGKKR